LPASNLPAIRHARARSRLQAGCVNLPARASISLKMMDCRVEPGNDKCDF
jgi:hypothetical protein